MQFRNHFLFSLLISLIGILWLLPPLPVIYVLLGIFFGILPDVDESTSTLGRNVKPVGWLLKHRGITHSVLPIGILGALLYLITEDLMLSYMVVVPYLGHLFLDSMTKAGIMPLFPVSSGKVKGFFKTGRMFDRLMQALWLFISAFLLVWAVRSYL